MFRSIRSILYLSFLIIGISLFLVTGLGLRQFQLSRNYSQVTLLSEGALFSFSTIREQVSEALITGDFGQIKSVVPELEQLNTNISRLYDSDVIPVQYKLAMSDGMDLTGLAIAMRKLENPPHDANAGLALQQEMRRIFQNLIQTDRVITGLIRDSVVAFQLSVIGAMGVLLSCAGFILLALYRKAVRPLLELSSQAENKTMMAGFDCPDEAGTEIVTFVSSANGLLTRVAELKSSLDNSPSGDITILPTVINETTNSLNGMINYAELMLESSEDERLSEEQRDMLRQIISNGDRIATKWQAVSQHFNA